MSDLNDLFEDTLKDVYYAERQILKALPKMMRAAENQELKTAFNTHKEQTEEQVARLQQVFELIGKRARGKTCPAINGIIEECEELLDEIKEPGAVRDAGLAACGQAVEHYEISRYGTLVAWAKAMGNTDAAALLESTLGEEKETDKLLSQLANRSINKQAASAAH
ncbi:YciE/YciF ferroxidase family protein [Plastoroseomonas hellenica]|uniref:Ferritin-like domain-containing protein n=1 Tax=Plastoroseomonas hellenica TaxID=2687306 RepID=A0ABS5F9Y5_9PROT|nr:ferritin-like domain-containing protein [Plastoroseomonas hellenica]MBR0647841.1 ferritin-like domain-containing protein [Plastoroseomonas hellenica]MBR0669374.1 ferritin-like domain-containing protein [Plastoroseomonas hellenica]